MTLKLTHLTGAAILVLGMASCAYDKDARPTGPDVAWNRANEISTNGMAAGGADALDMGTRSSASLKGIQGFSSDREPTPYDFELLPAR